jgi:hypothetical protein
MLRDIQGTVQDIQGASRSIKVSSGNTKVCQGDVTWLHSVKINSRRFKEAQGGPRTY